MSVVKIDRDAKQHGRATPVVIKNFDVAVQAARKGKTKDRNKGLPEILPSVPFAWVVIGPSFSGKTNLIMNILELYKKQFRPQDIILVSPSLGLDDKLNLMKIKWKYDHFDPEMIGNVMDQQKAIEEEKGKNKQPNVLLIIDDCANEGYFNLKGVFDTLFYRARHFDISLLVTSQKYSALSRSIRVNNKQLTIFKPMNMSEFDFLLNEHSDKYTRDKFKKYMDSVFSIPHSFVTIDYTKPACCKRISANFETHFCLEHSPS